MNLAARGPRWLGSGVRVPGSKQPVAPHIGEGAEDVSSPTLTWPGDLAWEVGDGGRRPVG